MKKMLWIITVLAVVGGIIGVFFMPDSVPLRYDMSGNIEAYGSRYNMLIFPLIVAALACMFTIILNVFEKKEKNAFEDKERVEAGANKKVLGIASFGTVTFVALLEAVMYYVSYGSTDGDKLSIDPVRIECIFMGFLFIVFGNFITKTRINSVIGIRTSWSMYNDTTWRKTNRFGAYLMIAEGIVVILAAFILEKVFTVFVIMMVLLTLIITATIAYSYKVYKEEKG